VATEAEISRLVARSSLKIWMSTAVLSLEGVAMTSPRSASLVLAAALALAASPARGAPPEPGGCSATLAKAVTSSFTCTVVARVEGKSTIVTITPDGTVAGVRELKPIVLTLASPVAPGSYTGEKIAGSARLVAGSGATYTAGDGQGEVALILDQAEAYRQLPGHLAVIGSLKARLVPAKAAQGAKADEVVLEVRF
jgi:hypothetical protein